MLHLIRKFACFYVRIDVGGTNENFSCPVLSAGISKVAYCESINDLEVFVLNPKLEIGGRQIACAFYE